MNIRKMNIRKMNIRKFFVIVQKMNDLLLKRDSFKYLERQKDEKQNYVKMEMLILNILILMKNGRIIHKILLEWKY